MSTTKLVIIVLAISISKLISSKNSGHVDITERYMTTGSQRDSVRGEVVVERFVDTLMASEKYLRMVEIINKKLTRLDEIFTERTNSILKYLSMMLRRSETSNAEDIGQSMKVIKTDIEKLKRYVSDKTDESPRLRARDMPAEGQEIADGSLDARLSMIESKVKTLATGVEKIVSTISEVKNRQHSKINFRTDSSSMVDAVGLLNEFRRNMYEQKMKKCDCKTLRVDRSERYPTDCHEIQMQGFNASGIYKIKPEDMEPFYVLCDLITGGGGWTVFQNRFDGSQDFYRGWSDYKHGFGNLAGEFWLGLDKIHFLTNQKLYELRIDLETSHGQEGYAVYSVFTVGPEHEGYRISTLGSFYGSAGDSLSYHAGQKFSTLDADKDEWKDGDCAIEHGGAWWYKECDKSNLNGRYATTPEEHRGQNIYWITFKGPNVLLTKTKMMIRPLPVSKPSDFYDSPKKTSGYKTKKSSGKALKSKTKVKGKNIYDISSRPYFEETSQTRGYFDAYEQSRR